MGSSSDDVSIEGWLYLIRSNRFGLQYMRKRYFILEDNALNCFRSIPTSKNQDPTRSALIDSHIRVTDNGRESINKDVFFTFTLYSTLNHSDRLKLGAKSSEEAARWTQYLMGVALKEISDGQQNMVACSKKRWQPFRLSRIRERSNTHSIDWTSFSSIHMDPMSSDVIAPSSWTIFGCKNGLRLFKEADDNDLYGKYWDDHPAVMAVGVVDACSEAIFEAVMCLGPSRSEWDFCFSQGSVIETLDGHTDIIHKKFTDDWLPWGMKRRDLLLQRYWRREDDGTYVILYHSVFHEKCKPHKGFIRAYLKSGGYVISPVNHGRQSAVKHMLAIDWNFWKVYVFTSSAKYVTINMLGRIAALRELFKAKLGNPSGYDLSSSGDLSLTREPESSKTIDEEIEEDTMHYEEERSIGNVLKTTGGSFVQLNDASDEFFDVPEQSDHNDSTQSPRPTDMSVSSQKDEQHSKLSSHELADQKGDSENLTEESASREQCNYGETLPEDPTFNMPGSWAAADPSSFLIRGETYLQNHNKIKASSTLMKMVAADWLKSDKREDNLSGRPSGIIQKYAAEGRNEFFFVINIQVPGATTYNLALYYMLDSPLEKVPLLESFVRGDDVFRNSRFKLIPYISKGSWIVKQSVGKKACLVGQALEINYFHGSNYLELDVDIGSSTVARGVVSLVLGYLNNLVIEMAFMIQANNLEELPEFLLGTCRLNHLDASKAVSI